MDRSTFLQSLPFLHLVPSSPTIGIWKEHREKIIEYVNSASENHNQTDTKGKDFGGTIMKKTTSRVNCLFSNHHHVASIEPQIYHNSERSKPAFFQRGKIMMKRNNGNSQSMSIPACCSSNYDPALVGFSAFLLPAEINSTSSYSQEEDNHKPVSPVKSANNAKHQPQTSPSFSAASTSMSSTQQGTAIGGKFENSNSNSNSSNDDDDEGDDLESLLKTHLLYFIFQNPKSKADAGDDNGDDNGDTKAQEQKNQKDNLDVYFVDHQNVQSLEIIVASPSKGNDKEDKTLVSSVEGAAPTSTNIGQNHYKPTSLLIKFDCCTFRIFGQEFILPSHHNRSTTSTTNDRHYPHEDISNYEKQLVNSLHMIRECITTHREQSLLMRYNHSNSNDISPSLLYSYLCLMVYPSSFQKQDRQESEGSHENGQIHNNSNETTDTNSVEEKDLTGGIGMTKEKSKQIVSETSSNAYDSNSGKRINRERKRKRRSYEKSWHALEKIHGIISARNNVDGLENNQRFTSLLKSTAIELGNSYVINDDIGYLPINDNVFVSKESGRRELDTKMSVIQHSIDETIQTIFPSSVGRRSKSSKKKKMDAVASEEQIEHHLNNYRKTIAAQHMMAFMPSR